jgi:serine protease
MYDSLGTSGVLSVAATSNSNVNIDEVGDLPTGCPSGYMISVTATNSGDLRTFSAYGQTKVDLAAPGSSVYLASNSSYGNFSGTSFASPCVAGGVALLYSAPCASLAAISHADPALAAEMVRDYIFEGTDPVANLTAECVTGGRLNLRNSLDLVLADCTESPCLAPFAVSIQEDGEQITLSWNALPDVEGVEVRYRAAGDPDWTVLADIAESSVVLSGLAVCTDHEVQLRSVCLTGESEWTASYSFVSAGCCEAPAALAMPVSSGTSLTVEWEAVPQAETYFIQLTGAGLELTADDVTGTQHVFENVLPCETYTVTVAANCADSGTGETVEMTVHSGGCADCTILDFCTVTGGANSEWIAQVTIHDLVNATASDGGYAYYGHLPLTLVTGETYPITCAPGYAGFSFTEYFKVWADWNADGVFATNEVIFDPGSPTTQPVSGDFTVPAWVTPGHIRIRVGMSYKGNFGGGALPVTCGAIQYGETEDYCALVTQTVSVAPVTAAEVLSMQLYPNPATGKSHVEIPFDGVIRVQDTAGRTLREFSAKAGETGMITGLPAGMYLVTATDGRGAHLMRRLVMQ